MSTNIRSQELLQKLDYELYPARSFMNGMNVEGIAERFKEIDRFGIYRQNEINNIAVITDSSKSVTNFVVNMIDADCQTL